MWWGVGGFFHYIYIFTVEKLYTSIVSLHVQKSSENSKLRMWYQLGSFIYKQSKYSDLNISFNRRSGPTIHMCSAIFFCILFEILKHLYRSSYLWHFPFLVPVSKWSKCALLCGSYIALFFNMQVKAYCVQPHERII